MATKPLARTTWQPSKPSALCRQTERFDANESLQASAKANTRESVRLLHDALFDAVLQTMIDSNFEMFKRINDNEDFGRLVREKIFEQVYREVLEKFGAG